MSNQGTPVSDKAYFLIQIEVVIDANGEDHDYLGQRMNSAIFSAICSGALTGDSGAEVDAHQMETTCIEEPAAKLTESDVADWLTNQIEDGHLRLEDITSQMARLALMNPAHARTELAERMGLLSCDQNDAATDQTPVLKG